MEPIKSQSYTCMHSPFEQEKKTTKTKQKNLILLTSASHTHTLTFTSNWLNAFSPFSHIRPNQHVYWKRNEIASYENPEEKKIPTEKKVVQSQSRRKQLNEINSCERLNEMEEHLRIDCFQSAVFHLFYGSISIKRKIYYRKKHGRYEEMGKRINCSASGS